MHLALCIKNINIQLIEKITTPLSVYLTSTLSNMLGFIFWDSSELKSLDVFTNDASKKLNAFLVSSNKPLDDDFNTALLLLAICMQETNIYTEDIINKYLLSNSKAFALGYLIDNNLMQIDEASNLLIVNSDFIENALKLSYRKSNLRIFNSTNNILLKSMQVLGVESINNILIQYMHNSDISPDDKKLTFAIIVCATYILIDDKKQELSIINNLMKTAGEYLIDNTQNQVHKESLYKECADLISKCLAKYAINLEIQSAIKDQLHKTKQKISPTLKKSNLLGKNI